MKKGAPETTRRITGEGMAKEQSGIDTPHDEMMKHFGHQRLPEEAIGAGAMEFLACLIAAHSDDGLCEGPRPQPPREFHAVHHRHLIVRDNDIESLLFDPLQSFVAADADGHAASRPPENPAHTVPEVPIIVNDQYRLLQIHPASFYAADRTRDIDARRRSPLGPILL